ncbi:MAG: polysaccharide deacetylase family protein [Chthoniobacterales bacterium]
MKNHITKFLLLGVLIHFIRNCPSLLRNSNLLCPVAKRFYSAADDEIWLTIDDGPSPLDTLQILDLLRQYHARASFFVTGENAEKHPRLIRAILAEGHEIGNHTHSHPAWTFWMAQPRRAAREIARCDHALAVAGATFKKAPYFRAPAGLVSRGLARVLRNEQRPLIGWSASGWDGVRNFNPKKALHDLQKNLKAGSILLLHQGEPKGREVFIENVLRCIQAKQLRCIIPNEENLIFDGKG